MPNLVIFEPGYAVVGAVSVPVSAAGAGGELRVGGDAGPVLRPLAFGERTRIVARMATSPQAAEGLGAAIVEAAMVEAGEADGLLVEILALALAGADAQGPLFSAAALMVARALGWDLRSLNALEAAEVDRLALHLGGPAPAEADDGWSRIVFVAAPPSAPEQIRRQLALQLLARAAPGAAEPAPTTEAAPALPFGEAGAIASSEGAPALPDATPAAPAHDRTSLGAEPGRAAPTPGPGEPVGAPGGASSPAIGAWSQAQAAHGHAFGALQGAGASPGPQSERPAGSAPHGAGTSPGSWNEHPASRPPATQRGPLPRMSFQLRAPSEGRPPVGRAARHEESGAPAAAGLPSNGVSQTIGAPAAFDRMPAPLSRLAEGGTSARAPEGRPAIAERGMPPLAPARAYESGAVRPYPAGGIAPGVPGAEAFERAPAALLDGPLSGATNAAPPTLAQLEQLAADELADALAALLDHEADLRGVER